MEPVEKKMNLDTSIISEELKKKEELLLSTLLTYDVLRIIFQYLRSYDLCQAAQVCRKVSLLYISCFELSFIEKENTLQVLEWSCKRRSSY